MLGFTSYFKLCPQSNIVTLTLFKKPTFEKKMPFFPTKKLGNYLSLWAYLKFRRLTLVIFKVFAIISLPRLKNDFATVPF